LSAGVVVWAKAASDVASEPVRVRSVRVVVMAFLSRPRGGKVRVAAYHIECSGGVRDVIESALARREARVVHATGRARCELVRRGVRNAGEGN
jgi:hypothetical protein